MKLTGKNGTQVSDSERDRKREDRKREETNFCINTATVSQTCSEI